MTRDAAFLALLTAVSVGGCRGGRALTIHLTKDVCVEEFDRVLVEVERGGTLLGELDSSGLVGFLDDGTEDIAIALDADVESVRVRISAWVDMKVVARVERVVNLRDSSFVEEEMELDGCTCEGRDYLFCEDFDDPDTNPLLTWSIDPGCGAGFGPFDVVDPGDRLWGDALRMLPGTNGDGGGSPCTIWQAPQAPVAENLYFRTFIRMAPVPNPGFQTDVSLFQAYGCCDWWSYDFGMLVPELNVSGWFDAGWASGTVTTPVGPSPPGFDPGEWHCMTIEIEPGNQTTLLVDGERFDIVDDAGGPVSPVMPNSFGNEFEIVIGIVSTGIDLTGWEIYYDEVAFDDSPIPCPDPGEL